MTNIPIAHCAEDINEADPLSTTVGRADNPQSSTSGRHRKRPQKHHNLTADDWQRYASEIASWSNRGGSILLQKERAIAIMRRQKMSGCAWWVATWWLEKLNRKTGSDWHGLKAMADAGVYDLKSIRNAVHDLERLGYVLRRKMPRSGFRQKGENDKWETTFPVLVLAAQELMADHETRQKSAQLPSGKKTSQTNDQGAGRGRNLPSAGKETSLDEPKTGSNLPPIPTLTEPNTSNPERASAPGEGVSFQLVPEDPIGDGGPGQLTIRESETSHWASWVERLERDSPALAAAAKARGAIEVSGSKWGGDGQFNRIAPPPVKRPPLRKWVPIATGADAGAAA